jgi:uncharacterized lipoprotein YddW (UPF0748 family)
MGDQINADNTQACTYMKVFYLLALFCLMAPRISPAQQPISQAEDQPRKREFRGVWVATVGNIDWPMKADSNTQQQQKDLVTLIDAHSKQGLNAIFFQVRPAADAFYRKSREPWSRWLTGTQGAAPSGNFDPLAVAISEAHLMGMELHAWINPYRATTDASYTELSASHITNLKPDWFFIYDGKKNFNPGIPEVRDYIIQVVLDIVDNYAVDGIHMDDYFYPYPVTGQKINDTEAFRNYGKGFISIGDWRRSNVNTLVRRLNDSIHTHNSRLKFGISPSAVWANKSQKTAGSVTRGGSSFLELYADSRRWAEEGWVDYIIPQLYRPLDDPLVAFNTMVDWWSVNTFGKHLYIGQGAYQAAEKKIKPFRSARQLPDQVRYLRKNVSVLGSVFFRSKPLLQNPLGFSDSLKENFYRYPALPPVMLWRDSVAPYPPKNLSANTSNAKILLSWSAPDLAEDKEPVLGYLVYRFDENDLVDIGSTRHLIHVEYSDRTTFEDTRTQPHKTYSYVVTAIDQIKNESRPTPATQVTTP